MAKPQNYVPYYPTTTNHEPNEVKNNNPWKQNQTKRHKTLKLIAQDKIVSVSPPPPLNVVSHLVVSNVYRKLPKNRLEKAAFV